jgi:hypothetical protein
MDENTALLLIAFWLFSAFVSFLNGLIRRLHIGQWLLISLLLGPVAFIISLFLTGRGYRASIFSKPEPDRRQYRPVVPSDEELLAGKVAFKSEILELKRDGKLEETERMLETLIDIIEEKARKYECGVPHWYYDQLAKLYRKTGNTKAEIRVLERWAARAHAPSSKAEKRLGSRLATLKAVKKDK